jgi:UPF0042 nucleotide-binding protein
MSERRLVFITGLSGSGRSAALKAFEDTGYYCVDNLPIALLPAFVDYAEKTDGTARAAIGLDVRDPEFATTFPGLYRELKNHGSVAELLFLEASDQTIVRRFSETRRPHPLAKGSTPLPEGIRIERAALDQVRKLADRIIETTDYTVHDLRQSIERQSPRRRSRPWIPPQIAGLTGRSP